MQYTTGPEISHFVVWALIGLLALWGGITRYLLDINKRKEKWSWKGVLFQIIISGFSGVLGGLVSFEANASIYMTYVAAGVASTMGGWYLSLLASKTNS